MALTTNNTHKFQSGELVTADKLNNTKVVQTGTTSDHSNFTGSQGQVTFNTTTNKLVVHDGTTAGGNALQNSADAVSLGAGSIDATNLATGAVTETAIANDAVTENKIKNNAVTENKIANNAVTENKIANGAVTSAKLSNTGVTAGSYTHSNITVDAQGRITSASSASSSGGGGSTTTTVVVGNWNSGWVNADPSGTAVANGSLLTFTHNLGTTDLGVTVYASDDSNGTNPFHLSPTDVISGATRGAQVTAISTTQVSLRLAGSGFLALNSSGGGSGVSWASKYIKVVLSGGGTGVIPGAFIPAETNMISSTISVNSTSAFAFREYVNRGSTNNTNQTNGESISERTNADHYPLIRVGGDSIPGRNVVAYNIPEQARYLRYRIKMTGGNLVFNSGEGSIYSAQEQTVGMADYSFVVERPLQFFAERYAYDSGSYGSGTNDNPTIKWTYQGLEFGIHNRFHFESYDSSRSGTLETFKLEGYYL